MLGGIEDIMTAYLCSASIKEAKLTRGPLIKEAFTKNSWGDLCN